MTSLQGFTWHREPPSHGPPRSPEFAHSPGAHIDDLLRTQRRTVEVEGQLSGVTPIPLGGIATDRFVNRPVQKVGDRMMPLNRIPGGPDVH